MSEHVKGYKVFNPDWTCRGFQFEVGKTFEEDVKPECCYRGFHFCAKALDCFNYYNFTPTNKVAEVEALGEIDTQPDGTKFSTNKLHIIREVTWHEVLELVNSGEACTGLRNSGNRNSGDWNSGNCNSGDWNSGNCNSGLRNSGNRNSGLRNSGNRNSGDWNSGNCNSGDWNSGNCNSGDWNSGDRNSGNCNSGDWNSGNCNSGLRNSGNRNSGDWNSGNCNSGDWNSGNCNSGDWNSGDRNSGSCNSGDWNMTSNAVGCFNTEQQKLKFFDKETDMTFGQWLMSDAKYLLEQIDFRPTEWIYSKDMTDEEKAAHPEHGTTGGYLKLCDRKVHCTKWCNGLSDEEKNIIRSIPNFDAEKFYQITGIRA